MTWPELEKNVQKLSQKITEFQPDCIIGVVRGGMIPARLLATSLQVKTVYCLTVSKNREERFVETEITTPLSGKKVLLVEDMLETGKSLAVAKAYLTARKALVKTACLYILPISQEVPDYYLKEVDETVTFPWE